MGHGGGTSGMSFWQQHGAQQRGMHMKRARAHTSKAPSHSKSMNDTKLSMAMESTIMRTAIRNRTKLPTMSA